MSSKTHNSDLAAAVGTLKARLGDFYANPLTRLLYIASTRDTDTGEYFDDRLATHFTAETAAEALLLVHREIFEELVFLPLQEIVVHVSDYVHNAAGSPERTIERWLNTKPYRTLRPRDYDPVAASVFFSQIRTALEIVALRPAHPPGD